MCEDLTHDLTIQMVQTLKALQQMLLQVLTCHTLTQRYFIADLLLRLMQHTQTIQISMDLRPHLYRFDLWGLLEQKMEQ